MVCPVQKLHNEALAAALQHAVTQGHRCLLLLTGSREWTLAQARLLQAGMGQVWVGDSTDAGMPASKVRQLLGTEYGLAVVDGWSGLHPDALAAVAGTVVAGGVLVLLTPPLHDWPLQPDPDYVRLASYPHDWQRLPTRFIERVCRVLSTMPGIFHLDEAAGTRLYPDYPWHFPVPSDTQEMGAPFEEQQQLINKLQDVAGHAVVLARRGRGKSAVLGFLAQALEKKGERVLLTASSRAAGSAVFRHAGRQLPFLAPDGILADDSVTADVLLVDEAASIDLPTLASLLMRFPRVIFATTTEGYEGTGQGFVLRFLDMLTRSHPGWMRFSLETPVRWSAGDPVEAIIDRLLLLDAETVEVVSTEQPAFMCLTQDTLLSDESLLHQVYGLLRSAHYRTTPDDLRFLMDAPGVSIYSLQAEADVVAVALLVQEGNLDDAMAQAITAGLRRPRGHLLVQTLAVHEGLVTYLQQSVSRVVRIAVHPHQQRKGLGSHLLQAILQDQKSQGVVAVGSSFSATPDVLAFWRKNGFDLVRVGHRRQAASAAPSAVVLHHFD
jgi:tRNA(Met) cytidine acetyltransferase